MFHKLVLFIAILALATLACGSNIDLPKVPTPGPEVTDKISVPTPKVDNVNLSLSFGAGEMSLAPGTSQLVDGTATYNYAAFKPIVNIDGGDIQVKMSNIHSFPAFKDLKNTWDLKLGKTPMDLSIEAGAYKGTFEFGGLALSNLTVKDGAAQVELAFSEPNLTEMSVFHYETGASDVKMSGLANANFNMMDFSAGAGDYTLDFSGELQRDASVKISSGLCNIILVVPEGVNAVVTVDGGASNISAGSGWSKNGNTYRQTGDGPTLTFMIDIGAGNVTLTK